MQSAAAIPERTRTALAELLTRPLGDVDILVLFIDGVMAEHTITVALGVDAMGYKHIPGLIEGATAQYLFVTNYLIKYPEN